MSGDLAHLYIKWYEIAQEELGSNLVKKLDDTDVLNWISREGWLMLPLPTERNMGEAKNRLDPNIYIELLKTNSGNEEIGIGLTCNTINSVEKMQNILDSYHNIEKEKLLSALNELDNTFKASISSKIKKHHFAQSPDYDCKLKLQSNKIDDKSIKEIFRIASEIRKKGIRLKETLGKSHIIEAPTFELAYCVFPIDEAIFRKKLQELKPLFETCLNVKKSSELQREKKKIDDEQIVYKCKKCSQIFTEQDFSRSKFCPECKNMIIGVKKRNLNRL